jgi:Bacteriophage tail sheath protein
VNATATAAIPGLYYTFVRPPRAESALRTDVAGFFGRTLRGPVATAVRVEGWREYQSVFGGLTEDAETPYAVRGYFDNNAQVAYVVRLLGAGSQCASNTWSAGSATGALNADWPGASGLTASQFQIQATSPGDWATGTSVEFRYWLRGAGGNPEIQIETSPPNESVELLTGLSPATLACQVNAQSAYIRMTPNALPAGLTAGALQLPLAQQGPQYYQWQPLVLTGGIEVAPASYDYLNAVKLLGDQLEVALVVSPDLYHPDFPNESQQFEVLNALLNQANRLHDRLIIIDVPKAQADPPLAVAWLQRLRNAVRPSPGSSATDVLRNGAVYHPRLLVPDPLGGVANPLRCTPCAGCVTGVISRLDLQQGAYLTPANAEIDEAVDLSVLLNANEQAMVYAGGMNLLTCSPSLGLLVWGGRVLDTVALGGFVAHRRLINLLVRAIRAVAEPLVFDTNGPQLWLAFTRSITTVLLQAYRAGALQGDTPSQAFQVTCDATTNPQSQIDAGMVVCLVQVAPAVPMEFITLRVSVSAQGQLEVFES